MRAHFKGSFTGLDEISSPANVPILNFGLTPDPRLRDWAVFDRPLLFFRDFIVF
jgi:hypothetical protein